MHDQNEIEKFDALANEWWNPNGKLKTLHDINPIRLQFIESHCVLKNKNILDIGCGGGILSESLAKAGAHVTAIDLSSESIHVAKQHANQNKLAINYQCTSSENIIETQPQYYDIVTCLEMLEHVPEPKAIIESCAEACKPGGHLFFSTINRSFKAYLLAIIAGETIFNILPKHTHEYSKFIQPAEMSQYLRESGLQMNSLRGMHYNPVTRKASLTDDVSVNYLVHVPISLQT